MYLGTYEAHTNHKLKNPWYIKEIKRKGSKHDCIENHQHKVEESMRIRNRIISKQWEINHTPIHVQLSIITLNINGPNTPIIGHRMAEWIRNEDSYICCL